MEERFKTDMAEQQMKIDKEYDSQTAIHFRELDILKTKHDKELDRRVR